MLSASAVTPQTLWSAWNLDPVVLVVAFLGLWYRRGTPRGVEPRAARRRARAFAGALGALVVALASPLDALAGVLLSAHMVQHVLLLLVAAPLLAWSAPSGVVLRGAPRWVRRAAIRVRRDVRGPTRRLAAIGGPVAAWMLLVLTVWGWHAATLYEAALTNQWAHLAEHAMFLGAGVAFWRVVIGARAGSSRVPRGVGILLVFGMAMQGVLLAALLTFASEPWYPSYGATAEWGLEPLADQHLAGVLLWIPGSVVYLTVALTLLGRGLQDLERADATRPGPPTPRRPLVGARGRGGRPPAGGGAG